MYHPVYTRTILHCIINNRRRGFDARFSPTLYIYITRSTSGPVISVEINLYTFCDFDMSLFLGKMLNVVSFVLDLLYTWGGDRLGQNIIDFVVYFPVYSYLFYTDYYRAIVMTSDLSLGRVHILHKKKIITICACVSGSLSVCICNLLVYERYFLAKCIFFSI